MGSLPFFLSACDENRVGIIVTKRVGGAVARNHIRRRIKDALRFVTREHADIKGLCLVVVAKKRIKEVPFSEMCKGISTIVKNALFCKVTEIGS